MTPSPLSTRLTRLRDDVRAYTGAQEVAQNARRFEAVRDAFSAPAQQVAGLAQVRSMLVASGVPAPSPEPSGSDTGVVVRALREAFDADPEAVVAEDQTASRKDLQRRLDAIGAAWSDQVRVAWREHVRTAMPDLSAEVLAALRQRPEYAGAVERMEAGLDALRGWADALPQTESDVVRVADTAGQVRNEWDQLVGGSIDPDVLALLRAAGAEGAPLELLTDSVRGWLDRHGLGASFVVTMRAAPRAQQRP